MKKIKVLHTEWSDGWGGQEIRIIGEMIALREKGVELFLACREEAQIKVKAEEAGFQVFALPFKGNTDLRTLWGLIKIIRKEKIDIVNTHSGKDTWVGGLAAKIVGAKFIRTRHLSNPIRKSRLNFINELADYIFTTGESVRQDMIDNNRIDPNKIISIPTGIDETVYDPEKYDRFKCRERFGMEEDELAIGIVAVLRQFKRHDLFLEMAKILVAKYPGRKLKFYIAGEGPQRNNIEKVIEEYGLEKHVVLLGHLSNVPEFLAALDIFVLTSDSKEGVPQSVMQALMMKKNVIATNAGSTADLWHDENFMLIPAGDDMRSLTDAVSILIDDKNKRDLYAKKARKYIVDTYSRKVMQETIYEIYQEMVL